MGVTIVKAEDGPTGSHITVDRRLYLDKTKGRIVEDGDPEAAFLFCGAGQRVKRARFLELGGEILDPSEVEEKEEAPAENKEDAAAEDKDDAPEWTLSMDPATYLERYQDGPNAELAKRVLEHQE